MILHFLVEGPSEVRFLEQLLPRLLPKHTFRIYPHEGKGRLPDPTAPASKEGRGVLDQLPAKLRAWAKTLNRATDRVVVLVDVDKDDCEKLLTDLMALKEKIPTPEYLVRLAIEEVEAWYLGDWRAIRRAFPRANKTRHAQYQQDSVDARTWEAFQDVIGDPLERKPYWAERMGLVLDLAGRNRSPSFAKFCGGVRTLAGEPRPAPAKRKKRRQATR